MPLRFEAWTHPGSSTFEKRFDIPVAMPGSAGMRELSSWQDESIMVPASYSRLPELVSSTDGSFIRVFHRSTLIDEFDAERVSLTAGAPNTRTVSGPQRNGLVEGVGILPKDYPNHKEGAFDWKWGAENIFPDLSLADLGSTREEWEVRLLGERYQLDLSSTSAGTFTLNPDGIGSTAAIDYDAEASAIRSALEALTGIDDVSVVATDDQTTAPQAYWIVFETPKDLTTDMTLDQSGLTGTATLTKFNDGFDTSLDPTFTITVDGQTTNALAWDASANKVEGTATNNTGLQGLSNVKDVTVSGTGKFDDPWQITFHDPPDIGSLSITFTAGQARASQIVAGDLDPSPITKSKPVDAGAGSEEEHGSYDTPALRVVTTPLDTGAEWTLFVNAAARYAGSQIVINVTPGQTYSNITVPVYPLTSATFTLVLRETNGTKIKNTTPRDVLLTAGSYQDLTIDSVTIPDGVNQIIVRVAVTDANPAKIDAFYTSWETATFLEGDPEATWTQIIRELLEEAQSRGAGTSIELDATDAADSLGTSLSTMAYTQFVGNDAHLGQALGEGVAKGFHWEILPAADARVITPSAGTTHVIEIYKIDAAGVEDLTASPGGPTVTVGSVGVSEAQVISRRIPYTTLIGLGTGNVSVEDSNSAAETALGRIERVRDVEHLGNDTAVQDYLDAQFAEQALNLKAATATVLETASQIPGVDYGPGSKIWWQFPGILDKEARPVKRFSWTHGLTAQFRIEGSRILTGEAAVVSAVDMLLRKQGRRRDSKKAPSPTSLTGGGDLTSGAHIHVDRTTTQSIGVGGEDITWTAYDIIARSAFGDVSFPTTAITIQQPGYYNIAVGSLGSPLKWSSYTGGGTVQVIRVRGGTELVVAEWSSTNGQEFFGTAHAIPCESGDQITVNVDHDDGSAQDLAQASLAIYLVDRIAKSITASGYREMILADGPIAYWRLGETSGTTAVDETGNGHHGTYTNTPTLGVTGLILDSDTAVTFDRTNEENVQTTDHNDFDVSSITLEAWIKTSYTGADFQQIISRDNGADNERVFQWRVDHTTGFISFLVLQNGNETALATLTGSTDVRDGATHHVVLTYDGTDASLYIDGEEDASSTLSAAMNASTVPVRLAIRTGAGFGNNPFDGTLDEVAVYGRVLSVAEVAEHYNKGVSG